MAGISSFQGHELSEEDLNRIVGEIVSSLNSSPLGLYLQRTLEEEIVKPKVKLSDLEKSLVTASVRQVPWQRRLGNTVFQQMVMKFGKCGTEVWGLGAGDKNWEGGLREPISYIRRAQLNWEKRIIKSINSMCTELNVPLAQRRSKLTFSHSSISPWFHKYLVLRLEFIKYSFNCSVSTQAADCEC